MRWWRNGSMPTRNNCAALARALADKVGNRALRAVAPELSFLHLEERRRTGQRGSCHRSRRGAIPTPVIKQCPEASRPCCRLAPNTPVRQPDSGALAYRGGQGGRVLLGELAEFREQGHAEV